MRVSSWGYFMLTKSRIKWAYCKVNNEILVTGIQTKASVHICVPSYMIFIQEWMNKSWGPGQESKLGPLFHQPYTVWTNTSSPDYPPNCTSIMRIWVASVIHTTQSSLRWVASFFAYHLTNSSTKSASLHTDAHQGSAVWPGPLGMCQIIPVSNLSLVSE